MPKISARRLMLLLGLSGLIGLPHLFSPAAAWARGNQVSILQEDSVVGAPSQVLQELRHLGSTELRLYVHWSDLAPNPSSSRRPKFNASDPAAYAASKWASYDNVVRQAQADGITVLMTVAGHAPRWAFGKGEPSDPHHSLGAWKPSASEWGRFFTAVAKRYSGHYRGLPAVHNWEVFNEANFGEDLSPQSVGSVYTSAVMYRGLVADAWRALRATGHRRDTVLIGSLAARGQTVPRVFGETPPLAFVRELYCLDRGYRPLRGSAARQQSCPGSASAFRRQNPGLFNSSGFSIHPYPLGPDEAVAPSRTRTPNPDYAAFSQLPSFTKGLDRAVRADGSGKRFPLWNTEYGSISKPPNRSGVNLTNQAAYLNGAEYLSFKNPRLASFMQYLLVDTNPRIAPEFGGFSSGLLFYSGFMGGRPKPALDAWRLPLYLPKTSARKGHSLEVWGCVRPAAYASEDGYGNQTGHIQFRATGSPLFEDLATVTLGRGSCYFDRRIVFASSGTVRLTYSYPPGDARLQPTFAITYHDSPTPYVSRSVPITVR